MKLGFIGFGNMGSAILRGILGDGDVKKTLNIERIFVSRRQDRRLDEYFIDHGVAKLDSNSQVYEESDVIIFAVKPQMLSFVLAEVKEVYNKDKLHISIAAGKGIDFFKLHLDHDAKIVRAMPNINATIGRSVTALVSGSGAAEEDKKISEIIFKAVGSVHWIDEKQMGGFAAIAGCSPAWIYRFVDSLASAGVEKGFKKDEALKIIGEAMLGSSENLLRALDEGENPSSLIDRVCSPAGTTIAGLHKMEDEGFSKAVRSAVVAACKRDLEISS